MSNLPPGCGRIPGEDEDGPCDLCRKSVDDCICAACPVCGAAGMLFCYVSEKRGGHNMVLTVEQVISRQEGELCLRREQHAEELNTIAEGIDWLKEHPERIERGVETENLLRKQLRGYPKDFRPKKGRPKP